MIRKLKSNLWGYYGGGFSHSVAACLTLVAVDVKFCLSGLSWTLFHYEILLPLTAFLISGIIGALSAWSCALLVGGLVVLYFEFGLTLALAQTSLYFKFLFCILLFFWIMPCAVNFFAKRRIPVLFVLCTFSAVAADKFMFSDQLLSSFSLHFLEIGKSETSSPSDNLVYKKLASALRVNRGAVLVIYESLGVPVEPGIIDRLRAGYPEFSIVEIPHEGGSTVSAEVRYLCGVNGSIFPSTDCLAKGPDSLALHGNVLSYFNRYAMYNKMGFSTAIGRHEAAGLDECRYAYNAVCDSALINMLSAKVSNNACQGLYYMLTIDSHFPYEKYGGEAKGMFRDLESLLKVVRTLRISYPECQVVIAGDHPPPLASGFRKDKVLMISSNP